MEKYLSRIADQLLADALEAKGAVLIEGPKWCGKTSTALQRAKSVLYMQDPAKKQMNIRYATTEPSILLEGLVPRLIDEWQIAPQLWDAVRHEVDMRDQFSQFILTGSTVPADTGMMTHSGIGRIARLTMRPMTLFESLDSTGEVSLKALFAGQEEVATMNSKNLRQLAFLVCRGGWPKAIGQPEKIALRQSFDYFDGIISSDISMVDGIKRNPQRVERLMKSYARNTATQAKVPQIRKDMIANDLDSLDEITISSYIQALKQMFVIDDLPAWNPNLRSKTAIRTSDTRHFVDPSIAVAALGIGPEDLIGDLKTFGFFFESMCVRDLRVYAEALGGKLYHYRDQTGLECDAVIHLRNGAWAPVEIKLGIDEIDSAAKNLLELEKRIDPSKMKSPSFMLILTGTSYAYRREDGIFVVPIGVLKH